jgi:hypothetical protein
MKTKQTAMSIAFVLLAGCKAVSYQPDGFQGGYSDNVDFPDFTRQFLTQNGLPLQL